MTKNKNWLWRLIGLAGVIAWLAIFIDEPSFPTPDKLIILIVFVFMIFGRAIEAIKRFSPFVLLLLAYETFRGLADDLNSHVNYSLAPHFDKFVFSNLPTATLQNWLWHGHVVWYDYFLYFPYLLHFVIPLGLGILVWHTQDKHFWRVMNTFLLAAFGAFVTYLLFPAAPPWLASQNHYIQPITRISSEVWSGLGLHDFPSFYQHISPNAVAAIPSLHAAWATLLFIFVYKLYGRRWAILAVIYPLLIFFGTIYEGEHYAFDVFAGIIYAVTAYYLTPVIMQVSCRLLKQVGAPVIPKALKN